MKLIVFNVSELHTINVPPETVSELYDAFALRVLTWPAAITSLLTSAIDPGGLQEGAEGATRHCEKNDKGRKTKYVVTKKIRTFAYATLGNCLNKSSLRETRH